MPTGDFRTQPTRDKTTEAKNMTKEEVIDRLKHCIQQQDPVFKEQFLSISKEPEVKIGLEDFRKVGAHAVWGASFLTGFMCSTPLPHALHSLLLLVYFAVGKRTGRQ